MTISVSLRATSETSMGSGSSKGTPTILRGYHREKTFATPVLAAVRRKASIKSADDEDDKQPVKTQDQQAEQPASVAPAQKTEMKVETETPAVEDPEFVKCVYTYAKSKWPAYCFGKTNYSVNGYHGGATALFFCSSPFGGVGQDTNAELMLIRSGFDCNHSQLKSIFRNHQGHFGPDNSHIVSEDGRYVATCQFGNNHIMILTNDSRYGNLRNGIFIPGADSGPTDLPIDVNDGGMTMILCSGTDSGTQVTAIYMLRLGFKDNKFQAKLLTGDDKYQIQLSGDKLQISGVPKSCFGLFHNINNLPKNLAHTFVCQTQVMNGTVPEKLVENIGEPLTCVVLCSNSVGTESSTASSVYYVTVTNNGTNVVAKQLSGLTGEDYDKSDLWSFEVQAGTLMVTGPTGACKYGIMTNRKASLDELKASARQTWCLATGEKIKTRGQVKVSQSEVSGKVNKNTDVCIMVDHKIHVTLSGDSLQKDGSKYHFTFKWKDGDLSVGYHIIRVFAVRKHTTSNEEMYLELSGSPCRMTKQKPGVVFATNGCGPAYQALTDIVYGSEFERFANFSFNVRCGTMWTVGGMLKTSARLPASMLRSHDSFLHCTHRNSTGADFEKEITYAVDNIPDGRYKLRIHLVAKTCNVKICGENVADQIKKVVEKQVKPGEMKGPSCYIADVDVNIMNDQFTLKSNGIVCAFALLDRSYTDGIVSDKERQVQTEEKQKLSDTVTALATSATHKQMDIVGWSPNLLKNASGETGSMSCWNVRGDMKVIEGGYSTETKFTTSHMWCMKHQDVDLLEHFSAEYLDTAPDIQVLEMFVQGAIGGGFYELTAQLLSQKGKVEEDSTTSTNIRTFVSMGRTTDTPQVIKEFIKAEKKTIYNSVWQEASFIFTNYGPGVRTVSFSSKGKDDKGWAGHYGAQMSGAQVRVKRETKPAMDDAFKDIDFVEGTESEQRKQIDKLVTDTLTERTDLLQDAIDSDQVPVDKEFERQTQIFSPITHKKRRAYKKREIRVFVSSTFRDFTNERETIIKKAFREINKFCADRGVFFTYVDLRWGISTEQTDDGKTISICLQEIDRCRPYFFCLMGDRFGWCQREDKVDELLNRSYDYAIENNPNMSWIGQYRFDSSVTQLEIFHGALNNPEATQNRSFFYLRETPDEANYTESEYKRLTAESEWHKEHQDWLKSEVQKHAEFKIKSFKTAEQVADLMRDDLKACVDEDFPKGTELTKLEVIQQGHESFANARCRVYIGREAYFATIDENRAKGANTPFVILGESGCGKSALVANWLKRTEAAEPDTFVFFHFIGSSTDSASYIKLLRRLFEELKMYFNIDMQIPSSDSLLINELPKWLRVAGSRTKVVLAFDALNQLDDGTGEEGQEHELLWIPQKLPPNVFLLLSTLPGRAMSSCQKIGWPSMKVEPLQESMKREIITDYLEGIYGKTLHSDQKQLIIDSKQTTNPLFLKTLLDEVRMYGSFRTLTDKILDYLKADNPGDLFAKILSRLEEDFETKGANAREKLVRDTTVAIWCSSKGMSEAELVDLLQVPSAVWSPFYLSLFENLINRNGLVYFSHDHLRQAVEKKYLMTAEEKKAGYLKLANFFEEREMSNRKVEELPNLLAKAGELDRLRQMVSNLEVFYRLADNEDGVFELVKAWNILGGFSLSADAYNAELAKVPYEEIRKNAEHYCDLYSLLGNFFLNLGLMEAAKDIFVTLIKQLELNYGESHGTVVYNAFGQNWAYRCQHPHVIKSLQELGRVYGSLGQYNKAVSTYKDAIARQNRIRTPTQELQLCEGLIGLAMIYVKKEDMAEAKKLMTRALELAINVLGKKHVYVATILTKLGQLSYQQGRIDESLAYYLQDLKLTRSEVGTSHPRIATVLNEIGLVYDDKNDTRAGQFYEAALRIILETFGNNYLGTGIIRYNLGAYYFGTNYFAKAKYQFTESYQIHVNFLGEAHVHTALVKKALDAL